MYEPITNFWRRSGSPRRSAGRHAGSDTVSDTVKYRFSPIYSTYSPAVYEMVHVVQSFTNQLTKQLYGIDCSMVVQMMVALDNT